MIAVGADGFEAAERDLAAILARHRSAEVEKLRKVLVRVKANLWRYSFEYPDSAECPESTSPHEWIDAAISSVPASAAESTVRISQDATGADACAPAAPDVSELVKALRKIGDSVSRRMSYGVSLLDCNECHGVWPDDGKGESHLRTCKVGIARAALAKWEVR